MAGWMVVWLVDALVASLDNLSVDWKDHQTVAKMDMFAVALKDLYSVVYLVDPKAAHLAHMWVAMTADLRG